MSYCFLFLFLGGRPDGGAWGLVPSFNDEAGTGNRCGSNRLSSIGALWRVIGRVYFYFTLQSVVSLVANRYTAARVSIGWLKIQANEDADRKRACDVILSKIRSSTTQTACVWSPSGSIGTTRVGYGVRALSRVSIVIVRHLPLEVRRLKTVGRAMTGHSTFIMSRNADIATSRGRAAREAALEVMVNTAPGKPQYRRPFARE